MTLFCNQIDIISNHFFFVFIFFFSIWIVFVMFCWRGGGVIQIQNIIHKTKRQKEKVLVFVTCTTKDHPVREGTSMILLKKIRLAATIRALLLYDSMSFISTLSICTRIRCLSCWHFEKHHHSINGLRSKYKIRALYLSQMTISIRWR